MFPTVASCHVAIRSRLFFSLLVAAIILPLAPNALAQTPAFPGALGFGAYATGGRNGSVYHVTTLADSGTGSFRTGVASGNRVIVFDVGGTITLASAISCSSSLTIAGQTAPGGICFNAGEISFAGHNNIICRFIRIRPGSATSSSTDDALSFYQASNIIMDHSSIAFAPWNNIDGVGDSTHIVGAISLQHCIDADPIGQQFGCHSESVGGQWSWQYNIFANSHNRNPLAKVNDTFINNVEYNNAAGYTTHTSTPFKHDLVNNYFVAGPASGGDFPWYQVDKNQSIYYTGNLYDSDKNGALNGSTTTPYWYQGVGTVLSAPWSSWTTVIPTMTADLAYRYDLSTDGAFPRDDVDTLIVNQIKTLGNGTSGTGVGTSGPGGGLYSSQADTGLSNNGYGTLIGGTAPANFSNDGIADYWKLANGMNTNTVYPLTNTVTGYTLLENYLNFLAAPHAVTRTNTPVDLNLSQFVSGFAASATFTLTNATNGTVSLLNSTNAHFVPTANFSGLGTFTFIVTEGSYAISAPVTVCVTPIAPPASAIAFNGALISVATNAASTTVTPPANLLWHGDGSVNAWNTTTSNWLNGASASLFKNGDVVTFDDTGSTSPAIAVSGTLSPGALFFNNNQNYTLTNSGVWSGSGALSKTGYGTLTVSTTNSTYNGSISVNGGALIVGPSASVGSGNITLSGGATFTTSFGGALVTIPGTITVAASDSATLGSGFAQLGNEYSGNIISGDTNSVLTLTNGVSFNGSSSSQFSGFTGTIIIPANATLRFALATSGNTFGSLNPTFLINGTLQPRNSTNTVQLGALSGSGMLTGPQSGTNGIGVTVYNIGGNNQNAVFTGTIASNTAAPTSFVCLVKVGAGTQTLNGNNTFTGTNAVLAGALFLNGTNTPSLATVFSGATLGGTGVITGPVSINSGGILSPGVSSGSVGTLTLGSHLTNATPTLYFGLSGSPAGANDHINMSGTLAMSGVQTFNFNLTQNALGAGTYGLIEGANNSTQSGVSFASNLPGNTRQSFSFATNTVGSNPSYVRLLVTGTANALIWKGTNGNTWDLSTTTNWFNGSAADKFYNLDLVTFNDTATNGGVAISGTVSPATLLVSNSATSFTFSNGVVAGFTALTKSGAGLLTLNASNSYTGGTLINGGTVQMGNSYALGTGPVALNGGTLYMNNNYSANPMNLTGTNTWQTYGLIYPTNRLQGTGQLNLNIGGGGTFSPGGDWSGFNGTITITSGNSLRVNGSSANVSSANAVWNLGSSTAGFYNKSGGYTVYFGALSGGPNTSLSGASTATASETLYVIGDLNTNCTFNGVISDGAAADTAIIKSGNAMLTLTGSNTFTGDITVNSGTLRADNTAGSATGVTNNLEIFSGATLTGNGTSASATTIDNGAMLAPGDANGTLTFNNNLTLNDNSVLQFGLGTNSDAVVVGGDLFLTGQLNVTNAGGFGVSAYTIFTCAGALTFDQLVLASAPAGYNYSFNTNTPGVVKLIVAPITPPIFGNLNISSKTNLVMSGSNGAPLGNYYVLSSTNLALPLANWTRVATNQYDASGKFIFTNPISANQQNFFRLQQ